MANSVLEIIEGPGAGTTFDITAPTELGRDPSAGIVLQDAEVSRHHARVSPGPAGLMVEDLGSSNGTYLNEQPVQGQRELRPGDELRAGVTVFSLQGAQQASGALPMPQITQVGAQILQPVAVQDLPPVAAEPAAPGFLAPETEPGYIAGGAGGGLAPVGGGLPALGGTAAPAQDVEEGDQYRRVAALRDPRVKSQTRLAAAGFLLLALLAVIIYFGVTS